jgi:hypothetical protein
MTAQKLILEPRIIDLGWAADDEFEVSKLACLAQRRPADTIEVGIPVDGGYFTAVAGDEAVALLAEALQQLPGTATWVVLKDIQQDTFYAPHVDGLFQAVLNSLHIDSGVIFNRRCHVFISSGGARTPLHADDCNGVLVQVSGCKEMVMYDMGRNYFSPRLARLRSGTSRVFALPANHVCDRQRYVVQPGTGLTVPWNWPHEAMTPTESRSISINVSFETPTTTRCALIAATNDLLLHAGRAPLAIGSNERSDAVKALLGPTVSRVGLLERLERKYQSGDSIVAGL